MLLCRLQDILVVFINIKLYTYARLIGRRTPFRQVCRRLSLTAGRCPVGPPRHQDWACSHCALLQASS